MTVAERLRAFMRSGALIQFTRPFESGRALGYVRNVGREFFLMSIVSDGCRFDGFQAIRLRDVRRLKPHRWSAFVESALKARRERRPRKPKVSVASLSALLSTAGRRFPLVSIHRERHYPNECQIGRVIRVARGRVSLLLIDPGARWDDSTASYALREITRVDFGGTYEDALYRVGGDPER